MGKGNIEAHGQCDHCGAWRDDVAQGGQGDCLRCRYEQVVYCESNHKKAIQVLRQSAIWPQRSGSTWILRCPPAKGTMTLRALCVDAEGARVWGVPGEGLRAVSFETLKQAAQAAHAAPPWWPLIKWKARPRKHHGVLLVGPAEEVALEGLGA